MNEPEEQSPKPFVLAEQWWPGLLFWIVVCLIYFSAKTCNPL